MSFCAAAQKMGKSLKGHRETANTRNIGYAAATEDFIDRPLQVVQPGWPMQLGSGSGCSGAQEALSASIISWSGACTGKRPYQEITINSASYIIFCAIFFPSRMQSLGPSIQQPILTL